MLEAQRNCQVLPFPWRAEHAGEGWELSNKHPFTQQDGDTGSPRLQDKLLGGLGLPWCVGQTWTCTGGAEPPDSWHPPIQDTKVQPFQASTMNKGYYIYAASHVAFIFSVKKKRAYFTSTLFQIPIGSSILRLSRLVYHN